MSVKHEKFDAQSACRSAAREDVGIVDPVVGAGVGPRVGDRVVGAPVVGEIDGNQDPPSWQSTSMPPGENDAVLPHPLP